MLSVKNSQRHLTIKFPVINELEVCDIDIKAGLTPLYCDATDKNGGTSKSSM